MTAKKIRAVLAVLLLLACLPVGIFADEAQPVTPEFSHAEAAYLYNIENDQVLFTANELDRVSPASTVKLMTAIVVFDHFGDALDTPITVTQEMLNESSGNRIGFYDGEIVTVGQMLNCMLINSANDAAIILAHATAGSVSSFVQLMNDKAIELGAYHTNYTNPTGMHDDAMTTTAADTAKIAVCAYNIPGFIDITSTVKYVMETTNRCDFRNIYNRNCMVSKYYSTAYFDDRVVGLNAGATTQGGYAICAVATDEASGLTYLAVVLGAEGEDDTFYNYINAENLIDWAFSSYGYIEVLSNRKMVTEIPVALSSTLDYVTLVPQSDIVVYLPTSVDLENDIRYSIRTEADSIDAPVEAGEAVGTITVYRGEQILGSTSLITTTSIARSEFLYFLQRVKAFTGSRFFRGTLIAAVLISAAYIFIKAQQREKKLRHMSWKA